ncbi:MAG TPA: zf-HC2 domain-containing protein [Thermoanaerobaculia bacterium]|jgi:hypothetical protein
MTDVPRLTLEEWLRAAYAGAETGCPPPEAFLEAESGALTPAERRRLDEHAGRCPACAAERDLARAFDAGPAAPGVRAEDVDFVVSRLETASPVRTATPSGARKVVPFPAARRPAAWPAWRLAAAALVVLAAGLIFQLARPGAPPLPPPAEQGGMVRGGEVEAVSPVGEVAGLPAELRWMPRPGAVSYRVSLSTVDDTVLWEATVPGPPARLPAGVVQGLHRAVVYVWRVEALDAAGKRLAASEPVRFRARPREAGSPL